MDSRLRKPNFIYECFVELARPKEGEEAQITYVYPKDYVWDDDLRKQLPKFTFPTTRSESEELEHFTFVLTDLDSKYRFGFCRYPPKSDTCSCFVSDLPWYKVFFRAMDKISDLKLDHQNELIEPFLGGLRIHPFPSLGAESIRINTGQVYSFPLPNPNKLPEIPADHNLTLFYTSLHYNVILHLFANMLFERRIIITASSLSLLSASVHGAVMILYPLHWQHIFIPITPPHLIDYCAAPMPFLMGVHSSMMEHVHKMPTDDVVILDVDESTIESPYCDDLLSLPPEVIANLKHILKKQSSAYGATVARAFMLAQVSMLGGYRSALKLRQGQKEVTFDEDAFLKSRPNLEEFLGKLLHFQHFRQFINGRIDKLKEQSLERDLFDNEVLMYEEELRGSTQEQMKLAFQKFATSTVEGGKKLGDKLSKQAKQKYKILDKRIKNMKRQWQERIAEQKSDYHGHTIENMSLVGGQLPENKSRTLPESNRSHPTRSYSTSTEPYKPNRPPPPVIPYQRHLEGKRKLAESLRQSGIVPDAANRDRANSLSNVPVGVLLNLTPPNTPLSAPSAEQSSLDQSERLSLDSKGSNDASIASGEVATGNLVDLSLSDGNPAKNVKPGEKDGQDTDTESVISTCSSSDEEGNNQWERFDDDKPPTPPPRTELHNQFSSKSNALVQVSDVTGRSSPFDDFSSSIAQALFDNSKRRSDPFAATTFANMSRDICKTIGEELPPPLIPTSSSGNITSISSTALHRNYPHVGVNSSNTLGVSYTQPACSASTPNVSVIHTSSAPKSSSAGNSPVMPQRSTQVVGVTKNSHNDPATTEPSKSVHRTEVQKPLPNPSISRRPPPPKPQPYSGGAVHFYREKQQKWAQDSAKGLNVNGNNAYDPFGGLFGDGGLHAYAKGSSNSDTSTANCPQSVQSKESPLV